MPSNVAWFERLMYGGLLLGLVGGYFIAQRELATAADDVGLTPEILLGVIVAIVAVIFLIWALLIWLVARRRKGWARYVLAVWFVLSLVTYLQGYDEIIANPIEGALNAIQLIMELVALVLVFTGNAREWFVRPAPQH